MIEMVNILAISELQDILNQANAIPEIAGESRALFVSIEKGVAQNSPAAILSAECFEEDDIKRLEKLGLMYLLGLGDIHSIVRVAKQTKPDATPKDFVDALNYYLDNDSFMEFD